MNKNIKYKSSTSCQITISNSEILKRLYQLLEELILAKVKRIEIKIKRTDKTPSLDSIIERVSSLRYHFIDKLLIQIEDIPYCLVKQPESFVFFKKKGKKVFSKTFQCQDCKYNQRCKGIAEIFSDILDSKKIKAVPDLPKEVMIEIEEKCNLNCEFCFNKNSFAKNGRNIDNQLTTKVVKEIIRNISQANIPIIRFTGGEPLLRQDIWKLADYAKNRGLETRLNTNGTLIKNRPAAEKIANYFDNVLLSIQYADTISNDSIVKAKVKAVKLLQWAGVGKLRVDTVATKQTIHNLKKVYYFIKSLGIEKWELNRPIPSRQSKEEINSDDVKKLVDELLLIRKVTGETHYIINAVPFCSYQPIKIQAVAIGAYACDGHERLVIDPRGFIKPIYYMNKNIGNPTDILSCWNHPFMKKMRNFKYVPKECADCIYLEKCRGGCRFSAHFATGSYRGLDPLTDIRNKINNGVRYFMG